MTESELVDGCRNGDREAQRELYALTCERIYALLVRMTGHPEDAFDLAQDTYLRAFARIGQFDGRSSLATWLYRIAVTQALQFLRRNKRVRTASPADEPQTRVESTANQSIARLDVESALAALDPGDRLLLLLRYQEGLDYRTIAEVAQCAEGTVASGLNRARRRLRGLLDAGYGPGEETGAARHPRGRSV